MCLPAVFSCAKHTIAAQFPVDYNVRYMGGRCFPYHNRIVNLCVCESLSAVDLNLVEDPLTNGMLYAQHDIYHR